MNAESSSGQSPGQEPVQGAAEDSTGSILGLGRFRILAVLDKNMETKTMLAEVKASKALFAIKVLKKHTLVENDEAATAMTAKKVLLRANQAEHPFIVQLHSTFQTDTRVCFVMENLSGGDLMMHLQIQAFGLERTRFYAAEICLALKFLHESNIISRNMQLDSLLLTADGHVKLTDFRFAKEDAQGLEATSTFCGTCEFMAPEIMLDKRYGFSVDWWAFGIVIYQMILQTSPFQGEDMDDFYDSILTHEPLYLDDLPANAASICNGLLAKEPEKRLGSGPGATHEIMDHPFFEGIDWTDVYHKRIPPPFVPKTDQGFNLSNFSSESTSATPRLTPVESVLTQAMQEEFQGFSWNSGME